MRLQCGGIFRGENSVEVMISSTGRCRSAIAEPADRCPVHDAYAILPYSQRINYSYEDIIRGIKLAGKLQKRGGSSIQNSLVVATRIFEV